MLYVISGVICAGTGIIYSLQSSSSIYTAGTGLELNVVAVVLFGGVSIFGGRGTVLGVVLSAVIVGLTEVAFTLINISAQDQQVIFGGLLLLSVVVPNAGEIYRRAARTRSPRPHSGERGGRLMRLPPAASTSSQPEAEVDARARRPSGRSTSTTQWRRAK